MEGMTKCPYCAEDIKEGAIKCKHCHSMLKKKPLSPNRQRIYWVAGGVILVVLIFIAAMSSMGDQQQPLSESTTLDYTDELSGDVTAADLPEEPVPEMSFISLGEKTEFAEWEYKVNEVEYYETIDDETARGMYAVFMVELTNNADIPRSVGRMFQLEDDAGRVYSFDSSASLAHHHAYRTDIWHLEEIGPTFTGKMPIAFDIPKDTLTLYFYPRDFMKADHIDLVLVDVDYEG